MNKTILTEAQKEKIKWLAEGYKVEPPYDEFYPQFDLPDGWVAGWVGRIYVGISPEGESHS